VRRADYATYREKSLGITIADSIKSLGIDRPKKCQGMAAMKQALRVVVKVIVLFVG
jgi:hypothetical protein